MKIIFVNLILSLIILNLCVCCRNNTAAMNDVSNEVPPVSDSTPPISNKTSEEPPPLPPQTAEKTASPLKYQNDDEKLLFEAIESADAAMVGKLLNQGISANSKAEIFTCAEGVPAFITPLGKAVDEKKLEIARLLLEHRADVNTRFFCGKTIFYNFPRAVSNQDLPMMKLLVEYHADTKAGDDAYPLITQAKTKEVLDYLVEIGFDINAREGYHGFTALFLAVRDNNLNLVKAILQHKPDLTLKTEPTKVNAYKELTALQWAKAANNKEIVKELQSAGAKK